MVLKKIQIISGENKGEKEWRGTESNRRRRDFQSLALPTELPRHRVKSGLSTGLIVYFSGPLKSMGIVLDGAEGS